ncbi:MAG TPA: hypothetical protein VFJ17_10945 [Mycobacteriales bacterium]|jgi:hypothetical protein|nr:hypothetical protein [Mycobacteriales bacterium]
MALVRLRPAAAVAGIALTGGLLTGIVPSAQATGPYSTTPVVVTHWVSPTPILTGIRVGRHATFDRVVFDLKGKRPGYNVRYVTVVRNDASGKVITMAGRYYLMIRLTPTDAHDPQTGVSTYTGPRKFWVGYPELRQVAFAGDFEAVVSVALGLARRNGFHVFTLTDPRRVVVDIRH